MRRMNQILGLFFSKDVRKQNPNDFAKPGRDLENNQASLFEKLHSSDSAKHERQRIFGPLAALAFNLVVAVGIIFLNKWVLENVGFQFPVCLTVIHYAVSWALMASLKFFSILPASPSSELAPLSLFTFGFVNSVSTGLANVSLKYNSVGFYQMAKIAITPLIVLAEFIWYKKRIAFSKINVEDYTNHFGFFGFYDSFGSSWFACVPLEAVYQPFSCVLFLASCFSGQVL
ncbi:hypothetical protein ES332_D11G263900v1 [Gossypium tomentosum]|uniref:Sugar phosphate transporter domain-containing protein n=1 Tax=Gossypium tomentosum TaxID=34277 RepID=A0A5D2IU44_GOSTO|nr:hypothetical protein ES332_D11G263900v1 [Gossypium tomentosum]TYH45427.1 hypothetical protein ES332_D11G263900v1 [Gossypium tomentosum]